MIRFAALSTAWPETPVNRHATRAGLWPWLLTAALLAAYAAPWLVTGVAALSFGAYDLAEWATLPPVARASEPPLEAALLLRLVLLTITLLLALWCGYRRGTAGWWATLVAVALLAAAQLPPFEFFAAARDDLNYGQQFMLALIALVAGVGVLLIPRGRWRLWLAVLIALSGAALSYAGASEALALARGYGLAAEVGGGLWLSIALFAASALFSLTAARRE